MTSIIRRLDPSCLPRVAILVGWLQIVGSVWNSIGPIYSLLDQDFSIGFRYISTGRLVTALIFALAGTLLIIGAYKRSHLMLLPWLILEGLSLVLYFVQNILALINTDEFVLRDFAVSMVMFSIIGLCAYVWFAILAFYQHLRDEKRKPIQDDLQRLFAHAPVEVPEVKTYPPPYVIPITFSEPKQPPSQIRY